VSLRSSSAAILNQSTRQALLRVGIPLCVLGLVWYGYVVFFARPKAKLLDEIAATNQRAEVIDEALSGQFEIADRARAIAATALGSNLSEVSARFRDGLSRIAETSGLKNVLVDHGEPREPQNPARMISGVPAWLKSQLRSSGSDFLVLRGTVKGSGTLDQALRAVALLQAQSWAHRIEGITLRSASTKEGQPSRCEVTVEVVTMIPPGATAGELTISLLDERANAVITSIVGKDSIRRALAPVGQAASEVTVVAPTEQTATPPTPIAFAPYEEWRLTGIASGRTGVQAFFVNIKNNQQVTVQRGGVVLDAVLIEASGERAVVEISGRKFELRNGQTLDLRKPVG
jgi:hypothetical protein